MAELFNVTVPVVACVEGEDGEQATTRLRAAVEAAGFTTVDGATGPWDLTPFAAEDGTEPSILPEQAELIGNLLNWWGQLSPKEQAMTGVGEHNLD